MEKDILLAMEALLLHRKTVGVVEENIYLFATPTKGSLRPLRGNDCLNNVLKTVGDLEYPERVRSTELRKYCATVSQIADLGENDLRWLAEHLGHNLDVHREYYRLRESTVELSKVSRLLLALDEGSIANLAGKKLSEISVEGVSYFTLIAEIFFCDYLSDIRTFCGQNLLGHINLFTFC